MESKQDDDCDGKKVEKLKLERVLGLTVSCNAAIDCDPRTGNVIYPAGCVIVFQNVRKNKQAHIINSSKKTITSLAYSWDGKYIVTGECGHLPNVRIWDAQEKVQVAEFPGHKYGINCVSFSPNLKYVVSVGSQHDMIVNVWDWKNNIKVASNKVSSKVKAISFSSNGNYFVTVGNRHVKFWYLEYSRTTKYKLEAVPLMGRSAILGEQRNNYFCCVSCGRGKMSDSTFAITKSGLLCEFNSRRLLDKWVELRTSSANCMSVADEYVFVGCADGVVRMFSQVNLHFLTTLPKTHHLGVDVSKGLTISHMGSHPPNAKYPDTVALTYDELNKKVTCIYNDHSVYTWDVKDLKKIGKSSSYLYHSACIWGIEMYPNVSDGCKFVLPPGSFVTCSSDDTVRIWNLDQHMASDTVYKRNIYSNELLKVLYMDDDLAYLCDIDFNPAGSNDKTDTTYDGKNGVRCIRINADGKHLASGDRSGNIQIHDLQFMDEVCKIEAHDSEVLCLEYSHPNTGQKYLASASRDRLIHVFDVNQEYAFQQTLDDHSSSITAVRFLQGQDNLMMLSCGADKSVIFRSAQYTPQLNFTRDRHIVGKTTLYDMDVDVSQKHILTACQDRNIRVFNVNTGKQSKCFKGTYGEDGTLIKVVLDNSGMYLATSSTDKNLSIHDYYSGECVAATSGHSELVTGLKFTNDCKHLISVSGDGCIFVWKLPSQFTHTMQTRLAQLEKHSMVKAKMEIRRQTINLEKPVKLSPELSIDKKHFLNATPNLLDPNANDVGDSLNIPGYRFSVGQLPAWAKKQINEESSPPTSIGGKKQISPLQPKGRWAQRIDSSDVMVKSIITSNPFDETVELRHKPSTESPPNIRRETVILSNKNHEAIEFSPCANSMKAIKSEVNLREVDYDKVTKNRGGSYGEHYKSMAMLDVGMHRARNLTESSSGTSISKLEDDFDLVLDTEEHDGDVDSDDSETDTTETESNEIIYYPPSRQNDGDSSFKVQAFSGQNTRETHQSSKNLFNKSSDALSISTPEVEDGSEEDEVSTPVDTDRSMISMLNMSTENLDRIDKRETYMKNNYESLESGEFQDDTKDFNKNIQFADIDNDSDVGYNPRHSISAKFLSKSLSTAPSARNTNVANLALKRTKEDHESTSKKKQELTRALNDTKKKLESLGWKVGSKSVIDLSIVPEKDITPSQNVMSSSTGTSDLQHIYDGSNNGSSSFVAQSDGNTNNDFSEITNLTNSSETNQIPEDDIILENVESEPENNSQSTKLHDINNTEAGDIVAADIFPINTPLTKSTTDPDFLRHAAVAKSISGMSRESMRRACSLTDLSASNTSNAARKRLLPSTPHARSKTVTMNSKNRPNELNLRPERSEMKYGISRTQRNSASASLYSRQMSDTNGESMNPVSRSISMGSLNDVRDSHSNKSKVHRVPSVQTLNKLNNAKKSESESKADRNSYPLSKSTSNTNLSSAKKHDRRRSANSTFELRKAVFETSSDNSDKFYQRSRGNVRTRAASSSTDRARANSANRLSKSDSKNSLASSASRSNLSSRSSSERDLSKIARDVTERLSPSTTVTVAKTKHETYTKRNSTSLTTRKSVTSSVTVSAGQSDGKKELEKSPQELPVKDKGFTGYRAITQDVYSAPLSRDLCDSLAEDLRQVTSEAMVLFQRVTLDKELPQTDKNELMNILAQGVWQAQQNLRPAVPPLPMYSSKSSESSISQVASPALINFGSKGLSSTTTTNPLDFVQPNMNMSPDKNNTGAPDVGTMNMLQQYSDMLLNVIQQRMTPGHSPHK